MPANAFFDSSVLLYILSKQDPRSAITGELLLDGGIISVQVLNEFANVARRKLKMDWNEIEHAMAAVRKLCDAVIPITEVVHESALQIARRYRFQFYDSLIVAAALKVGAEILYIEDLQDGQKIGSLTIRNPFLAG
jgi:predicted nucleic acid-binding protein